MMPLWSASVTAFRSMLEYWLLLVKSGIEKLMEIMSTSLLIAQFIACSSQNDAGAGESLDALPRQHCQAKCPVCLQRPSQHIIRNVGQLHISDLPFGCHGDRMRIAMIPTGLHRRQTSAHPLCAATALCDSDSLAAEVCSEFHCPGLQYESVGPVCLCSGIPRPSCCNV